MILKAWLKNRRESKSHDATAFGCRYWSGDRAGVNLKAVCQVCRDEAQTSGAKR